MKKMRTIQVDVDVTIHKSTVVEVLGEFDDQKNEAVGFVTIKEGSSLLAKDTLNMSNANAYALLKFLNLIEDADDMWEGVCQVPIAKAKQAVLDAWWTFSINAENFVRKTLQEDNFTSFGIDEVYLERRLNDLTILLLIGEERNMTHLTWC